MNTSRESPGHVGIERCDAAHAGITVLIAVAVRLYRDGLAAALSAHGGLVVEATAGGAPQIEAAAFAMQPDVIVVDVSLPDVLTLIRSLRVQCAQRRILAFAVGDEVDMIIDYAKAGADGFFNANGSLADLVEAIERTAAGELLCSPRLAAELLRAACASPLAVPHSVDDTLTRREEQVLTFLQKGWSNKQIASALHVSEATVKNHVHHVLQKMHVATRGQAIARGVTKQQIHQVGS